MQNASFDFTITLNDIEGNYLAEGTVTASVIDGEIFWTGNINVTITYDPSLYKKQL